MTTEGEQVVTEINRRLAAIDTALFQIKLPGDRNQNQTAAEQVAGAIVDLEVAVKDLIADPPIRQSHQQSQQSQLEATIDAKIRTAIAIGQSNPQQTWHHSKPILESKAMQDVGPIIDAKQYRP